MKSIGEKIKETRKEMVNSSFSKSLAIEHGKLPPQAVDLEEAVLGALMLERDALTDIFGMLKPEVFYKEGHQKIFRGIKDLVDSGNPVDILTVTNKLKEKGELEIVGGPYYISQLTSSVASTANLEYHSRILIQKYVAREVIRVGSVSIRDAFEDTTDVFNLLQELQSNVDHVQDFIHGQTTGKKLSNYTSESIQGYMERKKLREVGDIVGIPTPLTELDKLTGGWRNNDLIVMASRPGMGKTAFSLAIAKSACQKVPVAISTLEMSGVKLSDRMLTGESGVNPLRFNKGMLSPEEEKKIEKAKEVLDKMNIYIDDDPVVDVDHIRYSARKLKSKGQCGMLIIDYLQLVNSSNQFDRRNREQQVAHITRTLKITAKELNIPILLLAQLSRNVEHRGGAKRPILADLRESGAIEQDADMVLFPFRPAYYDLTETEDGFPTDNMGELIIAKHREGSLATVMFSHNDSLTSISDYEQPRPEESSLHINPNKNFENEISDRPF